MQTLCLLVLFGKKKRGKKEKTEKKGCLRTGQPDTVCISAIRSEVHCGAPRGSKARSRGVTQRHGWYVLACLLSHEERGRLSSILTLSSSKPCCAGIEAMLAACMTQQAAYRPKKVHHRLSGGEEGEREEEKSKCRGCLLRENQCTSPNRHCIGRPTPRGTATTKDSWCARCTFCFAFQRKGFIWWRSVLWIAVQRVRTCGHSCSVTIFAVRPLDHNDNKTQQRLQGSREYPPVATKPSFRTTARPNINYL